MLIALKLPKTRLLSSKLTMVKWDLPSLKGSVISSLWSCPRTRTWKCTSTSHMGRQRQWCRISSEEARNPNRCSESRSSRMSLWRTRSRRDSLFSEYQIGQYDCCLLIFENRFSTWEQKVYTDLLNPKLEWNVPIGSCIFQWTLRLHCQI